MNKLTDSLSPEAKTTLTELHRLVNVAPYRVRVYAPYYDYLPTTIWSIWDDAIDDIIPDEINLKTLKSHIELTRNRFLEFLGSDGSIAEFQFTRLGYEVAKKLTETDTHSNRE